MRFFVSLGLVLALLVPVGAAAQGAPEPEERNEAMYQGLWCLYLNAQPYVTSVPGDVVCDYEPRPMTKAEAAVFYQKRAQRINYINHSWECAEKKKSGNLAWKENRRWADKLVKADKRDDRATRSVIWPKEVRKKIDKLIDYVAEGDYLRRRAYGHKSFADSIRSGDWARYVNPKNRVSPTAQQIRQRLGLPDVPVPGNPCKAVKRYQRLLTAKRYERQQETTASFDSPYANKDLGRIARMLAGIGLVESRMNESDEASLFLTEAGLSAARAMPSISDDASAEEVVAGLFAPVAAPTLEPSSAPEVIELVLPSSEASPTP